jgi:gluconolactonase
MTTVSSPSPGFGSIERPIEGSITILAQNLNGPEGPKELDDGSILVCEMVGGNLLRVSASGSVRVAARLGYGINGVAIGPDAAAYVCNTGGLDFAQEDGRWVYKGLARNHTGGLIQRVDLNSGAFDILYSGYNGEPFQVPNDIVFDATGGFWFTDSGLLGSAGVDRSSIYWAKADGTKIIRTRLPGLPNGIALSPDQKRLYVALTRENRIVSAEIAEPGVLLGDQSEPDFTTLYQGGESFCPDGIAVEADGTIVAAVLVEGCLARIGPQGDLLYTLNVPDGWVTNLTFGGLDRQTLYATFGGLGQLAAIRWPSQGLRLSNT